MESDEWVHTSFLCLKYINGGILLFALLEDKKGFHEDGIKSEEDEPVRVIASAYGRLLILDPASESEYLPLAISHPCRRVRK